VTDGLWERMAAEVKNAPLLNNSQPAMLGEQSARQWCIMTDRRSLALDTEPREMQLQWGGFGTATEAVNRPILPHMCRCLGTYGVSTAPHSGGDPPQPSYVVDNLRRHLVYTAKGFSVGMHRWEVKIHHLEAPEDMAVRLVVGIATRDFKMGTRTVAGHGVACFLSHAGYVYGTNGFTGKGYPAKFAAGDTVVVELDMDRGTLRFGVNGDPASVYASRRLLSRDQRACGEKVHGVIGMPPGAVVTMVPAKYVCAPGAPLVGSPRKAHP